MPSGAARIEQLVGFAIAVERADVNVRFAGADANRTAAEREIRVDQRADVLVTRVAPAPQIVQLAQHRTRDSECAPDPLGLGAALLHLDFDDVSAGAG